MRVVPVLLVAGGIAWWSQAQSARCERHFAAWVEAFERSLRSGAPRLPEPAALADPLLESPIAEALAAGAADGAVGAEGGPAAVEILDGGATGFIRVRWRDRDGVARWIELRCDGASVAVSGVGLEPNGKEFDES